MYRVRATVLGPRTRRVIRRAPRRRASSTAARTRARPAPLPRASSATTRPQICSTCALVSRGEAGRSRT
ncbi:hypothetical protein DJ64_30920 [Streptomyces griseorubens]|uniref:Uncharacterized protein n=1 Tax=Streptomyces griseorubens TaxID=66897 RepID=A0ABR4T5I8_9ACTN|nr:hypothetical protein DJ64_30920 [Streptomyces griseorubens]